MDRLWSFSLGDALGRLLHLNMLLVRENTAVEVWLEGVTLLTVRAEGRLEDATHIDSPLLLAETLCADEMRLFHLRYNITVSDDNTSQ